MGADVLERRTLHALPVKPHRVCAAAHEDRVESVDSTRSVYAIFMRTPANLPTS